MVRYLLDFQKKHMKNSKAPNQKPNAHFNQNKHRPENKDNLDSREGEEQQTKGDDVTHNNKEVQNKRKSGKK